MAGSSNSITFVVGPTSCGKSAWAIEQAVKVNGVILNADSIQIYKKIDIGSAKPTVEDRAKVPHYLFDFVDLKENFSAGEYRRAALAIIEEQISRHPIFIVGGSGFYIQALEKGMYDVKPIPAEIREKVREMVTPAERLEKLRSLDPETANKIALNDPYRIQRALEVVLSEGRTIKQVQSEFLARQDHLSQKYEMKKVGFRCDRRLLRERVTERTQSMLAKGLVTEVQTLIQEGLENTKALSSVGYKECCDYLKGIIQENELQSAIIGSTMKLAKRQLTWFKRDPDIEWIEIDSVDK